MLSEHQWTERGVCCEQQWDDELVVALLVEILEVEAVVKDLVKRVCRVPGFTDLELDNDNSCRKQKYGVGPPSHSRDRVLEQYPPG